MSQLSAFIAFCRNGFNDWVRREIIDDDPWDEQILDSSNSDSSNSDSLEREDLQNISVMEPIPKADVPQSSVSLIQQ